MLIFPETRAQKTGKLRESSVHHDSQQLPGAADGHEPGEVVVGGGSWVWDK
jgi:hypothetical protein